MQNEQIPWWQSATIYQMYPRSFQDTDGDGMGDLRGIIRRFPYLVALRVMQFGCRLRGPRLDQRSVHRKMLVRQQRLDLRMVQKFAHELGKYRAGLQPIAVLREGRRVTTPPPASRRAAVGHSGHSRSPCCNRRSIHDGPKVANSQVRVGLWTLLSVVGDCDM